MSTLLQIVDGSLAILDKRVREAGQAGLTLWSSNGRTALKAHRATLGAVAGEAVSAEQDDLAAARLVAAAQLPSSPGGRNITPAEAAPILRLINRSALQDHAIAERLA